MGGRLKVDFESHLKLDPFQKVTYILKEGISLHLSMIKTQFRCFFEILDFFRREALRNQINSKISVKYFSNSNNAFILTIAQMSQKEDLSSSE